MARLVLLGQGLYYLVAGTWPLLHMRSFVAITGPKTDLWLVRTVAALIVVIGGVLSLAALRRREVPEISLLAVGSALALTAIDLFYSLRGRISRIYLLDAAGEMILALALAAGLASRSPREVEELAPSRTADRPRRSPFHRAR